MKLINPSVELIIQEAGIEGIYKQIERVGRTCYKSEDHITEGSAKPFVQRMIDSGHLAMLEHGTVYMQITPEDNNPLFWKVALSPYSKIVYSKATDMNYVTTNLRTLVEKNALELSSYRCEPTKHHAKRICLKFITSIGVSREFNRHRVNSVAEQSTRYCNYSKEKFGNEVTFVKPAWSELPVGSYSVESYPDGYLECNPADRELVNFLMNAEYFYMNMIKRGWKPQQAREVLPLSTATEVVYTAFEDDWKHFFGLRYREDTGKVHPNALQVATMAHDLIKDKLGKDL